MRHIRAIALTALGLLGFLFGAPASAYADATLFLGAHMVPADLSIGRASGNTTTKGFAIGAGLLVVGFEFEYSDTTDDLVTRKPSVKTGMGNVLLQSPVAFFGIQPYYTVGGGVYHEALETTTGTLFDNTGFGMNTGGGAKISLIGPIRLRVDYRVFSLKNGALTTPAHRVYAGLNLKF